MVHVTSTR